MSRFWGFSNDVAGCLLLQMGGDSVRAYNNADLIPNGYIDEFSVLIKQPYGQGRLIPSMIKSRKVLPSEKLYTEIWLQNGSAAIRVPDQFIQPIAGIDIQFWPFIGQITPIDTKYTYHVCESQTYINQPIVVDETKFVTVGEDVFFRYELPYYVIGVLGVTKNAILFATPNTPLTNEEQVAVASKDVSSGVQIVNNVAYVGDFNVKPGGLLSDTNKRKLLDIPTETYNELENLGNSQGVVNGWPLDETGQIQGKFKYYDYSQEYNLFAYVDRDPRKNNYRADNEIDKDKGHAFWNGSVDDITERAIYIKITGKQQKLTKNTDQNNTYIEEISDVTLEDKDTIYITYVGVEKLFHRHALSTRNIFFMYGVSANNLLATNIRPLETGPFNSVKQWFYKLRSYRLPKDAMKIGMSLTDYRNDRILQLSLDTLSGTSEEIKQKRELINASLQSKSVEGQRLIETRKNRAVASQTFVIGCYFLDARGICTVNFRTIEEGANLDGTRVLVPVSEIAEREWFDQTLLNIREKTPAVVFNEQGIINIEQAKTSFFGDFVFDVSELMNSILTDNQKYAYEPNLANALKTYPGVVGLCARLDLLRVLGSEAVNASKAPLSDSVFILANYGAEEIAAEQALWTQELDVSGAEFTTIKTQGSAAVVACNPYFDTTRFSIGTHLYIRTPTFLDKFGLTTRIYVEKLQGTNLVLPDGTIFIGAESGFRSFSIAQYPYSYDAVLVYTDSVDSLIKFRVLNAAWTDAEMNRTLLFEMRPEGSKIVDPQFIGNVASGPTNRELSITASNTNNMPDSLFYNISYDKIIGNVPNYYKGREVQLHSPTLFAVQKRERRERPSIIILDQLSGTDKIKLDQNNYYISITQNSGSWPDEEVYMASLRFKGKFVVGPSNKNCYNFLTKDAAGTVENDSCATEVSAIPGTDIAKDGKDYFDPRKEFLNRFISLVFPHSNRVIDKIFIDFQQEIAEKDYANSNGEYSFDFTIQIGYIQLAAFQIRQRPCIFFSELLISCENYLYADEFESVLVRSNSVSSCFDSRGNILIFYEDTNQRIYNTTDTFSLERTTLDGKILKYDGSHIPDFSNTYKEGDLAFSSVAEKEISCLLSPNNGETWYDYKAVVRTAENENIRTPYAFHDEESKCVHLFFTIGLDVYHKKIFANEFDIDDAFLDYKRPRVLNAKSPPQFGLYHFTDSGIGMRVRASNVVLRYKDEGFSAEYLAGSYDENGLLIAEPRYIDNNVTTAEDPQLRSVPRPDYFVYRDNRGQLNFVYRMEGKLYVKISSNEGDSWQSSVKYGLYIHKNAISSTPAPVRNFGHAYDRRNKRIYITYIADDMLFINNFDANIVNEPGNATEDNVEIISNIRRQIEIGGQQPIFVCGKIPESLIKYIEEGGLYFVFPYFRQEYTKFIIANNSNYDIADVASQGYATGDGRVRFFYEDSYNNLRAFTFDQVPFFDFNRVGKGD